MKIEYKLKQEDYKNALIELLRKEFWKRVILIFLIPLIISLVIAEKPINWKIFIISFLISFFGIIILKKAPLEELKSNYIGYRLDF